MIVKLNLPSVLSSHSGCLEIEDNLTLGALLRSVLGSDYSQLFDDNQVKGYVNLYHNNAPITNVEDVILQAHDEIDMLVAFSGG